MVTCKRLCSWSSQLVLKAINFLICLQRLKKAFYGLNQAPRAWFHKLKTTFLSWGFSNSKYDVSLFIKRAGQTLLYVLVYVDDILIIGTYNKLIHHTIHMLNLKFALKTLGSIDYFLIFEAFRNAQGIYLTQTKYILNLLTKNNLLNSKPRDTPIYSSVKLSLDSGRPFTDPTLYRSTSWCSPIPHLYSPRYCFLC
ncbi:hypothetical protein ACOSQ2_028710 [Xanthoceras sorbifolium]